MQNITSTVERGGVGVQISCSLYRSSNQALLKSNLNRTYLGNIMKRHKVQADMKKHAINLYARCYDLTQTKLQINGHSVVGMNISIYPFIFIKL